ncbi:MAG: serine hydrolase [Sphingobacteriales bacterium]|nr:serine hydrolase [Sphingobacteriales bacterium]
MMQNLQAQNTQEGDYAYHKTIWVENTLASLNLEQKIGQLMMVSTNSSASQKDIDYINTLVADYHIGGLIFFKGDPLPQLRLTNQYQQAARLPLLIGIDGEWGLAMRLSQTPEFPYQLMLGAIQDNQLLFRMGQEVARECRRMGIHINFAPVVDINTNANNPVIGVRSFGDNKYNVSDKAIAYMQGMEMNGILACAKHFPGHGDTHLDSHHSLPVLTHSRERFEDIELYPFKKMIEKEVGSMMIGHLSVPVYDKRTYSDGKSTITIPSSLSKPIITDLLKKELGFKGLIFTDALNMKAVSAYFKPGELEVEALKAGNDVLLYPENVPAAISAIKAAIQKGSISEAELDAHVRKILETKFRLGLANYTPLSENNLIAELNTPESELINRLLIENAITVVRNTPKLVPINKLETAGRFASVFIGENNGTTPFQQTLSHYAEVSHFQINNKAADFDYDHTLTQLETYNTVIIGIAYSKGDAANNWNFDGRALRFAQQLQQKNKKVILVLFGNPYILKSFDAFQGSLICAYQRMPLVQEIAAQIIFGGISAKGKLPVHISTAFPYGCGDLTLAPTRLKYSIPEEVGMRSDLLNQIDDIAQEAIRVGATPGCQVLIAKDGKVVFDKTYGWHTYAKNQPVKWTDLYDVASLTKIIATLPALMTLYEDNKLSLNDYLSTYLPELKGTDKAYLNIKDMLTHQAGLQAWIPFYKKALEQNLQDTSVFSPYSANDFSVPVSDKMYMNCAYTDTIWQHIQQSPLASERKYVYSDLPYYYFKKIIENETLQTLDEYTREHFSEPLGMNRTVFNPLSCFNKNEIAPTEVDDYFRIGELRGTVHDMGAAMLGGVGGHAGLFSNANDLAKIMQMYLNKGTYGNHRYFSESTVNIFTSRQNEECRRGLGFDKPETQSGKSNPCAESVSPFTFGHTGFTGTCAWADPQYNVIYIFLSNRTYPDMNNNALVQYNIRTRIQEVVYQAIKTGVSLP